jgi:hypothetical protein
VLPQIRAETKVHLEAAVRVTLINLVVALDPNLAFRKPEWATAPVPSPMTFQHLERVVANPAFLIQYFLSRSPLICRNSEIQTRARPLQIITALRRFVCILLVAGRSH